MTVDDVCQVIRGDDLILKLGMKIYNKLGSRTKHAEYISCKMREVARFLIQFRKISGNENQSMSSILRGRERSNIVKAVRKVSGYNEETMSYKTPSLALKVGHSINKCVSILIGEAVEREDDASVVKKLEDFNNGLRSIWSEEVSSGALRNLRDKQFNKPLTLPLAEDIKKFNEFLQLNIKISIQKVKDVPEPKDLMELSRLTLCLLIVFNRRRAGEIQRIKINDITSMKIGDVPTEIIKHLSPFEKKLALTLYRFQIIGKRHRHVPVLLTPLLKQAIDTLKEDINRKMMNIHPKNENFFAVPNSETGTLNGPREMRKYAEKSGAVHHYYLRSTLLRKHFGTMCQLQNLSENEMDIIANFMGHDIKVHRNFYRLPESTLQLVKMGKI